MTDPEPFDLEKRLAEARARFEARQVKLPPEQRRTWEEACAADHDDLEDALRRAGEGRGPVTAPDFAALLADGRSKPRGHRLRRVVVRFAPTDIERLDAARARWKAPRASLVRAVVAVWLASLDAPEAP